MRRLRALPPGDRTNHVLYHLLEPRVLGYWAFLEPKHKGSEIADTLIWWHDVVFLVEAKTRGVRAEARPSWLRGRIRESIRTLNARAADLRSGRVQSLRNKWRGEVKWDPDSVEHYYGVVVLNAVADPFDPRELATEAFRSSKIPIQVFSLLDLAELLRFVTTAWDLVVYYELRAQYGRRYRLQVGSEFEVYQNVLSLWDELWGEKGSLEEGERSQDFQLMISNAILKTKIATEDGYAARAASMLVDLAIASLARRADPDDSGKRVGSTQHDVFVRSMGAIAELSLLRRAFYGSRWVESAEEAVAGCGSRYKLAHSPSRSRSYVLAAFEPQERQRELSLLAEARGTMEHHGTTSCLALGADAEKVVATYRHFLRLCKGELEEELGNSEILDTTAVFIEENAPVVAE